MLTVNQVNNNFKFIMYLTAILGLITNIYIVFVLYYVDALQLILSPILGSLVFIICAQLMSKNLISSYFAFIISAYTVTLEVVMHTHYLGWGSGFFYFICVLPLIFLLNSTWKVWIVFVFNASLIIITLLLVYFYYDQSGVYYITVDKLDNINFLNQFMLASCVIVIMIFFSFKNNEKDQALVKANQDLEKQNNEISIQKNHLQVLLKEVHHRVKNNLQIISSLLALQKSSIEDEEIISVLDESKRRVEAIALIHQKLYIDETGNQVDFKSYLSELINSQEIMQSKIKCILNSVALTLNLDIAVPLGLIVSEMLTNSIKHAFPNQPDPKLLISLSKRKTSYELIVHDNGIGLPSNFSLNQTGSLGTEIIAALIEQIDANIHFENDNGAKFTIQFSESFRNLLNIKDP